MFLHDLFLVIRMNDKSKRRTFSIELSSKRDLGFEFPKGTDDSVLIEGNLGDFIDAQFVESAMLEIRCTGGLLRIDLSQAEWNRLCNKEATSNE